MHSYESPKRNFVNKSRLEDAVPERFYEDSRNVTTFITDDVNCDYFHFISVYHKRIHHEILVRKKVRR